jgi:antitoxin component of MazEF toxin-antitoxin module
MKDKMTAIGGSNGQVLVTIPRALALAMDIKPGDKLTWTVAGKAKLELTKE